MTGSASSLVEPGSSGAAGRGALARLRSTAAADSGAIAIIVAILAPVLLMFAAFAVDVAHWYLEAERVQKVADAASLAGVVYMPQDFATAKSTALAVASRNGYPVGSTVTVTVAAGSRPSQLQVTVSSTVSNSFATVMGISTTTVTRTATADYNGPAPMGSPCNTFGNEPTNATGGPLPHGSVLPTTSVNPFCVQTPQFWAVIEGPQTDKVQGDQYMTRTCTVGVYECSGTTNNEFKAQGYFFMIRVVDPVRSGPITVQLYDPAMVGAGQLCEGVNNSGLSNNMNQYTSDGTTRYARNTTTFCAGDAFPGTVTDREDTSFALRAPTDSGNPLVAAPISGCSAQYKGFSTVPTTAQLQQYRTAGDPTSGTNPYYLPDLAQVYHQWVTLCTITNPVKGDYYLQVRTNVALPTALSSSSTALIACATCSIAPSSAVTSQTGDDTGVIGGGSNGFGIRVSSFDGSAVSVAGYERMPIYMNSTNASASFNLIRVLPGAAGKFIKFQFYDAADGAAQPGSVTVQRPTDATGTIASTTYIQGCRGTGVVTGSLANCSATVQASTNNGQIQTMSVPVPADYSCSYNDVGGCWFRVTVNFPGSTVHDVTTWTATLDGDPVRIVQ